MDIDWIECPCCGDEAARGIVQDGQLFACGCAGMISLDAESPPEAMVDESISMDVDLGQVAKRARRAALLEAAEVAASFQYVHMHPPKDCEVCGALGLLCHELRRLAEEPSGD